MLRCAGPLPGPRSPALRRAPSCLPAAQKEVVPRGSTALRAVNELGHGVGSGAGPCALLAAHCQFQNCTFSHRLNIPTSGGESACCPGGRLH